MSLLHDLDQHMGLDEVEVMVRLPDRRAPNTPESIEHEQAAEAEAQEALPYTPPDFVRQYLWEIGKIPLLTAAEEQAMGRRIEGAQAELRRSLGGIPLVVRTLLGLVDRVRRGEIPLNHLILFPEGHEPNRQELRAVLDAFARVRQLERESGDSTLTSGAALTQRPARQRAAAGLLTCEPRSSTSSARRQSSPHLSRNW